MYNVECNVNIWNIEFTIKEHTTFYREHTYRSNVGYTLNAKSPYCLCCTMSYVHIHDLYSTYMADEFMEGTNASNSIF